MQAYNNNPNVIACIPAYNEEASISKVIYLTRKYVDKIVVCDDGSTDMTCHLAEALDAEVIRHKTNMGYGAAITSLFQKGKEEDADIMVTIDADGQHDPGDIPRLIDPIVKGEADIVLGSRFLNGSGENVPSYRKVGIGFITKLTDRLSYEDLTDTQSGFRAYSKKAIELIRLVEDGMGASTEILLKAYENGLRVKEIPIRISYRKGTSTQNPIYHGIVVVLSTINHLSINHPLIFYGIPGLITTIIALGFWVWTFQIFAATRQLITNIALVAIGATIVGLMLLTTAIILWVLVTVVKER